MSTATLARPRHPAHQAPERGSNFTGTLGLLRLYARRDRGVLPLWVLLLSAPVSTVYVASISAVCPTPADRAAFAASITASPAQRALYGMVYNDSLGAVGVWKAGMFHLLIAVAAILTVLRHTRAEEETGRSELIDSTAVGRYASLTAALMLTSGASGATGLIATAGLLSTAVPPAGSLAFGLALAGSGLVFTGVAAVCAQLSASARTARAAAFGVLAAAFTLRAVGDAAGPATSGPAGALSWASPLGWSLQVRPYAGDRWWVLLLPVAATAFLLVVAYLLLARRDVGAGLLAERLGPGSAGPALAGPLGLAWRLNRGAVLIWTVGLCLYALLIGSIVHGVGDEIGDSAAARDIVARLGGTGQLEGAFIAVAFSMLGMVTAAFVISLCLRLHQEEAGARAETVLAGAVSRSRWFTSYLVIAGGGSAGAMLLAGLLTGLTYGVAAGDIGTTLPRAIGTAAVQLPAAWLLAAVTVALFGVVPRCTALAWGVLVAFIAVYLLGSVAGCPQWLLDLEPFAHTPRVGSGDFRAAPLLWLTAIDATLTAVGIAAFRRRDLR